jgi:hypothetical protein
MDGLKGKAAGGIDVSSRLTVGQYLHEWIASKKEFKLNTLTSYTGHTDRYWEPHLGHLQEDRQDGAGAVPEQQGHPRPVQPA